LLNELKEAIRAFFDNDPSAPIVTRDDSNGLILHAVDNAASHELMKVQRALLVHNPPRNKKGR